MMVGDDSKVRRHGNLPTVPMHSSVIVSVRWGSMDLSRSEGLNLARLLRVSHIHLIIVTGRHE